jgi:hypothetical protein
MEGGSSGSQLINAGMDRYKGVIIEDMTLLAATEAEFDG